MPKTSKIKKNNKSKNNKFMLFNSINTLYIVSILAIIHLLGLVITNDNKTLFLFIILSTLIYLYKKNMIFVLGIPLIITSLLLLLSKIFSNNSYLNVEGFIDNTLDFNNINHDVIKEITLDFLMDSEDDTDYTTFKENINNKGNIAEIGEKLSISTSKNDNKENVEELLNYLIEINMITEDNALFNNKQVIYSKQLIERLLDNSDKILNNSKKKLNKKNKKQNSKKNKDNEENENNNEVENIKEAVTGLLEALNNAK
jgi:hypothetical protein